VTTGGLIGKVAGTEKGCAILEVAPNVRVKVELTHVIKKHDETVEVVAAEKVKSS
jgi:preprotein translocase subunit YajC